MAPVAACHENEAFRLAYHLSGSGWVEHARPAMAGACGSGDGLGLAVGEGVAVGVGELTIRLSARAR